MIVTGLIYIGEPLISSHEGLYIWYVSILYEAATMKGTKPKDRIIKTVQERLGVLLIQMRDFPKFHIKDISALP